MLVVECNFDLLMCVIVKIVEGVEIVDDVMLVVMVNVYGNGCFVIMFDLQDKLFGQQLYQGIVLLLDENGLFVIIIEVFEYYM